MDQNNEDGLFYSSDTFNYYLLYEPSVDYLQSNKGILNEERAKRIKERLFEKKAIVFGVGKYIGQRQLTKWRITFCQIPYELHRT